MWVRDRLDGLFADDDFADWYSSDGRKGLSPARLALVSVLQYAENLTDRQAAEAVRCRIDWKYCLGMELEDPGFDFSVLSEFRDRMVEGDRADRLLAVMVGRLVDEGLVGRRGRIRTDSTHVLAAVRRLNRVELVGETVRLALDALAARAEGWLLSVAGPDWVQRYGRPVRYERLPRGTEAVAAHVLQVGRDGIRLLEALYDPQAPHDLRDLPAVQVLRQVWIQQYWYNDEGQLGWRGPKSTRDRASRRGARRRDTGTAQAEGRPDPATARVPWASVEIVTPHDPQARYSQKVTPSGQREWIGYRDHQTEACSETGANVIVQVVTRPATEQDIDALDRIHQGITAQDLQPTAHLVDGGYTSPDSIHHAAQKWNIDLVGPVRVDRRAAERPGFAKEDFHVDWQARTVTCPNGVSSPPWKPTLGDGHPRLSVLFPRKACRECPDRARCTGNTEGRGRHIFLLPQAQQEIQTRVRQQQDTDDWKRTYALRAGCEATVSETVHAHGLRNCRYRGLTKTHVQHVLTAAGANIIRLSTWDDSNSPHARTHRKRTPFSNACQRPIP